MEVSEDTPGLSPSQKPQGSGSWCKKHPHKHYPRRLALDLMFWLCDAGCSVGRNWDQCQAWPPTSVTATLIRLQAAIILQSHFTLSPEIYVAWRSGSQKHGQSLLLLPARHLLPWAPMHSETGTAGRVACTQHVLGSCSPCKVGSLWKWLRKTCCSSWRVPQKTVRTSLIACQS